MVDDADAAELIARWRAGDARAEEALFSRYTTQLIALARSRLSPRLAGRLDAEDVVQSAYGNFFASADRFVIERGGELWGLLAKITLRELYRQAGRHTAERRNVRRELPIPSGWTRHDVDPVAFTKGPSAEAAIWAKDELETAMAGLSPLHRRMVELRLQGHLLKEVAQHTNRSERLVRFVLGDVRARLIRLSGSGRIGPTTPA